MNSPLPLSLGALYRDGTGDTAFRVWAPDRRTVEVSLESPQGPSFHPLSAQEEGYFAGTLKAAPGARYRYRLDGSELLPDPCSRFQPDGPHGPSEVIDPWAFPWTDGSWPGLQLKGQVFYEVHLGAFSPQGGYRGLEERLPDLARLGVTCLELMPLATFPGRFNWGYDGVDLFAPCAVYGRPDGLRRLVDRAHGLGLGVILDVVYNHLGPDGNYLARFASGYHSRRYPEEWGTPLNFEDRGGPVRAFVIENACHWIHEYHLDGLRLDATQSVFDASPWHILGELTQAVRTAAQGRSILLVSETEPQDVRLITAQEEGGLGNDAIWVDDFHHTSRVALTGPSDAYLRDYRGTARELLACALEGALFQGQWYAWQNKRRGSPLWNVPPEKLIFYLQNHDQVANSLRGARLHQLAGVPMARALTTYWLMLPQTPLLFMGQEFFASSPWQFFADHHPELQAQVTRGRTGFLAQFAAIRRAVEVEGFQLTCGDETFTRSRLDWSERDQALGAWALRLHAELLRLRREDPVFAASQRRLRGAALSDSVLALRTQSGQGERLVLLNLGPELQLSSCAEPVLAPAPGRWWRPLLGSEECRFGGCGASFPDGRGPWRVMGHCAMVLELAEE